MAKPNASQVFRVEVWRPGRDACVERVREDALDAFIDNVCSNYPDSACVAKPESSSDLKHTVAEIG